MKRILVITGILALLWGCEDPLASTAVSQDEKIDSFISSKYADSTVVYNRGVNRIVLSAGDSTRVAASGDTLSFDYIGYTFNSSIESAFCQGSRRCSLGSGELIDALEYGLEGMTPGEHSYIISSCKYGYDNTVAGVGRDKALVFEVLLNEIIRPE